MTIKAIKKNAHTLFFEPVWGFGQTACISAFIAALVGKDGWKSGLYVLINWLIYLAGATVMVLIQRRFGRK